MLPSKLIPLTPEAPLPITRTASSLNLTILPLEPAINISSFPVVFLTEISSSSSFKVINFLPLALILSNSDILVLLIKPDLVAKIKYL